MPYHKRTSLAPCPRIGAARALIPATAVALLLTLSACGGGGGGSSPVANGIGSPQPIPAPAPGASAAPSTAPSSSPSQTPGSSIVATPAALAFASAQAPNQSVSIAQPQNTTGFTLSTTTCANIVRVNATTGAGPFTFTPVAAGSCSYLVTGINGETATIPVSVTTTSINVR